MSDTDVSDTDEPEDAVELEVSTEQGAIDFVDHNVDAASAVEVAKIDIGPGFNCRATGFAGGSTFVPSTDKTAASKAQAKADAAEIESLLLEHPDIAQVAVVGAPDDRLGEVGVAFVVPATGATPTPDEVVAWSREHMANFKVPRTVEVVDALPINASGKVVKDPLRERAAELRATPSQLAP